MSIYNGLVFRPSVDDIKDMGKYIQSLLESEECMKSGIFKVSESECYLRLFIKFGEVWLSMLIY